MTNEVHILGLKAIKSYLQTDMLRLNYEGKGETDVREIGETMDAAIEALTKQIPKKPILIEPIPNNKSYRCPNCNMEIVAIDEHNCKCRHEQYFCKDCGQAIDWRNE